MPKTDLFNSTNQENVIVVDINDVIADVNQPRKMFDKNALTELASSIKEHGVIQPILVTKLGNKYQIVAGERRYRASRLAGLLSVPVIVKDFSTKERKEVALIENLQRQDLNPIEEAYAYKSILEEFGITQEELAKRVGKSRPVITNSLRLLTLNPAVIDMVASGRLSAGHARCLASIKQMSVQESYAKACCDKQMSVRSLEVMVYNYLNPTKKQKRVKEILSTELKDLVNDMQRVFGTKVKVIGNNNKGRICIDYFTQDDLSRIFDIVNAMKKGKNR